MKKAESQLTLFALPKVKKIRGNRKAQSEGVSILS